MLAGQCLSLATALILAIVALDIDIFIPLFIVLCVMAGLSVSDADRLPADPDHDVEGARSDHDSIVKPLSAYRAQQVATF